MHQKIIGPQVSKYAQTSPSTIDCHVYLLENKVIKAFTANNFISYNKSGDLFILQNDKPTHISKKIKITWRIQKNRQNGQAITLSTVDNHPQLCPICSAL
jgi:hypothetical protein